nr:odorant receptor 67c-like [Nomia melanderi]
MEEDCVKYAAIDSNKIIPKTSDLSYRITSSIAFVYLVAATTYAAGTLSVPRYNDSLDRQLILNMDLPFDTNVSPTYELIVAAQVIHQVAAAYTFGIFGALLLMMILHIGCLVDILCHILTNISSKDEGQVRFVAMRHQEIIMFTERIEKFFTYISLLQLLANTLTSCCLGFLIIVVSNSLKASSGNLVIIKCCWFYMVLCLEIFIYCFAGEYLNVKVIMLLELQQSDMIIDAAYQVTWYDLQPTISRQLVLLILRSQKGMPLTFGKFSTLSLESFSRIMKASASYMSVLLAMY